MTTLIFRNQFFLEIVPNTRPYQNNMILTTTLFFDPEYLIVIHGSVIRVTKGTGRVSLTCDLYTNYHGSFLHFYFISCGGHIDCKYLDDCVHDTIGLHEKSLIIFMLMGWKPDMKDVWRELGKYLTKHSRT